ncbi:MAG: winged helix DNA-binding domain-containing protein [Actinobacteria bacterium]|nr:winged helix DNA-binding domain-containing protein [Actinomycetota bacterium]
MVRIGIDERRARLGMRHFLARPAGSSDEAAAGMVGLHSSAPVSPFLSARARVGGFVHADLEDALYERRSLVRMLGMRRTLFVVPRDLAAVMHEACTKAQVPRERTRLVRMLEDQGIVQAGRGARWVDRATARTLEAIDARGEAGARELTAVVPELAEKLRFGEGKRWAGTVGVSTRVLFLLATEGRIVRARPAGGWTSSQYRWARTEAWLGAPLATLDHAEACAELLRRWLGTFGPGTSMDIRWWTGWTAKTARATLEELGAVEVELDGGTGYVLPDDLEAEIGDEPWVALLPGLDPTVMGWKERTWYVGNHEAGVFDTGNAGPTIMANGRVIGSWAQRADGEIAVGFFGRVDRKTREAVEAERERLRTWVGDVRFGARFPTPLAHRLASG